jgi:hypothetical protein
MNLPACHEDRPQHAGIPQGGWRPKGRKAEDGPIVGQYQLVETHSASYLQGTEWNVRDSDATFIFTISSQLYGGSKRTADFARSIANLGFMWLGRRRAMSQQLPCSDSC